jgi:MFS transporter, ACS family, glucarate transporter
LQVSLIEQGLPSDAEIGGKARLSWGAILSNGSLWAVTFSYFAYGYVAYIFFTWFSIYLSRVRHLDVRHSTIYTMMPLLAMALGSPIGGFISDRLTKRFGKRIGRCYLAAAAIAVCAIFIALGTRVASAELASVVLAGGAGALYVSQSSFWSISADIGKNSAGSVSGFMNMGGQFGGALTAYLTPVIADHFGWAASFATAGCVCGAGAISWLLVKPEAQDRNRETVDLSSNRTNRH